MGRRLGGRRRRRAAPSARRRSPSCSPRCRRARSGRRSGCSTRPRRRAFEEQLELEATTQAELTRTSDFREGVAAFLEKRDASVHGRSRSSAAPGPPRRQRRPQTLAADRRAALGARAAALARARRSGRTLRCPSRSCNWFITLVRGRPSDGRARVDVAVHPLPGARQRLQSTSSRTRIRRSAGWRGTIPGRPRDRAAGAADALEDARCASILVIPAYVFATVLGYVLFLVAFLGCVLRDGDRRATRRASATSAPTASASRRRRSATCCSHRSRTRRSRTRARLLSGRPVRQQLLAERQAELLGLAMDGGVRRRRRVLRLACRDSPP